MTLVSVSRLLISTGMGLAQICSLGSYYEWRVQLCNQLESECFRCTSLWYSTYYNCLLLYGTTNINN